MKKRPVVKPEDRKSKTTDDVKRSSPIRQAQSMRVTTPR